MQIPLVGRDQDLVVLQQWLAQPAKRLVTVTGPGGVGKTRLALEVATALEGVFDHITVVRLDQDATIQSDAIPASELVLSAISRKVQLPEGKDRPLIEHVIRVLGDRPHLLLLDNFEHLLAAAPTIGTVVAACSRLHVLITSREALRIQPEHVFELGPLKGTSLSSPTLAEIEASAAGALFLQHARMANTAFTPNDDDAPIIAEICVRLGGLPLALELAASRMSVLSPAELRDRLGPYLPQLLTGRVRDAPPRLMSMHESVSWSYDLLSDDERHVFRRTATFVGAFTLEAALSVAAANDSGPWVEQALESLIAKHLVYQVAVPQDYPRSEILKPRFAMLEPIREYALGALEDSERAEVERKRAQWCLALCTRVSPNVFSSHLYSNRSLEWEQRLDEDYGTLRATLAWALEHGATDTALQLTATLADFWYRRGYLAEGHHWLQIARPLANDPTAADIKVLTGAALVALSGGQLAIAASCAEQGLILAQQSRNIWAEAEALAILGDVAAAQEDDQEAYRRQDAALRRFRDIGDSGWTSATLHNLALSALRLGQLDDAARFAFESLDLARATGDSWMLTYALHGVGAVACHRADTVAAADAFAEALDLDRDRGTAGRWRLADALAGCAVLAWLRKEPERAARLFGAAETRYRAAAVSIPPPDMPMYSTARAGAIGALGSHAEFFLAEGTNQSEESAVAEADDLLETARARARSTLSDRETEVLRLIAQEMSDKEIARALQISVRTAEDHAQTIRDKLGVRSRTKAVAEAKLRGFM